MYKKKKRIEWEKELLKAADEKNVKYFLAEVTVKKKQKLKQKKMRKNNSFFFFFLLLFVCIYFRFVQIVTKKMYPIKKQKKI